MEDNLMREFEMFLKSTVLIQKEISPGDLVVVPTICEDGNCAMLGIVKEEIVHNNELCCVVKVTETKNVAIPRDKIKRIIQTDLNLIFMN